MTAARGEGPTGLARPPRAHLELEVPARARSVGEARHAVTAFLTANAVPSGIVDDMELITSELVTNAVLHPVPSGHPVRIQLRVGSDTELEVSHYGPTSDLPPVEHWRPAAPTDASGRGLGIVRRLSDEVWVRQDGPWAVVVCGRKMPEEGSPR